MPATQILYESLVLPKYFMLLIINLLAFAFFICYGSLLAQASRLCRLFKSVHFISFYYCDRYKQGFRERMLGSKGHKRDARARMEMRWKKSNSYRSPHFITISFTFFISPLDDITFTTYIPDAKPAVTIGI